MKKPKNTGMRLAAAAPSLSINKKMEASKTRKGPAHDVAPKDDAYDRNFTKQGKPRLSATSGEGSMGQRR